MRFAVFCAVICLALLVAGCSSVESRIKRNPASFANLSSDQQALVLQGQISEGMGKEAVYLAWGRPAETAFGSVKGKRFEEWRYFLYTQVPITGFGWASVPLFTGDGVILVDRACYEPGFLTEERLGRRVVFENDKVVRWEAVTGW